MSFVYLLWYHGEDGPVDLKATLDRYQVIDIAKSFDDDGWFERVNSNPIAVLKSLLDKPDRKLTKGEGIHNLMNGWGGLHFQVKELISINEIEEALKNKYTKPVNNCFS